jgi:hypothetical protein
MQEGMTCNCYPILHQKFGCTCLNVREENGDHDRRSDRKTESVVMIVTFYLTGRCLGGETGRVGLTVIF